MGQSWRQPSLSQSVKQNENTIYIYKSLILYRYLCIYLYVYSFTASRSDMISCLPCVGLLIIWAGYKCPISSNFITYIYIYTKDIYASIYRQISMYRYLYLSSIDIYAFIYRQISMYLCIDIYIYLPQISMCVFVMYTHQVC